MTSDFSDLSWTSDLERDRRLTKAKKVKIIISQMSPRLCRVCPKVNKEVSVRLITRPGSSFCGLEVPGWLTTAQPQRSRADKIDWTVACKCGRENKLPAGQKIVMVVEGNPRLTEIITNDKNYI